MKTKTLPFGHPETLREGPFPCKGSNPDTIRDSMVYTVEQRAWMKENKPLLYTGKLNLDISHLPQHLRHL